MISSIWITNNHQNSGHLKTDTQQIMSQHIQEEFWVRRQLPVSAFYLSWRKTISIIFAAEPIRALKLFCTLLETFRACRSSTFEFR